MREGAKEGEQKKGKHPSLLSRLALSSNDYALICFGDDLNYHSCCTAVLLNWNLFSGGLCERGTNGGINRFIGGVVPSERLCII